MNYWISAAMGGEIGSQHDNLLMVNDAKPVSCGRLFPVKAARKI
jgi:hypothetical protein